ncbi:glycosyltransferase [Acinetobacter silvestris]|uniref:Glycosyltransferase 2-like domain-containing protein n=1 Tax=Acinetobacter silvestris TaxID=1977882 RepID=A0A1Y3CF97_9GAMM|nr:glycosyltransferase [Acinetobacter silvestris]OTG63833.1 hypothetical protein B9T28_12645 [Acinetobacter silvestris]
MRKLISLIIPVYNVEEYIEECLKSVINQITMNIEVIIVNDGTPDNSMKIINGLISQLPKNIQQFFILLEQENQGQSVARNNGLNIATGEYVAFLDSDDILAIDYFDTIFKIISKNNYDILRFNARKFIKDTNESIIFNTNIGYNGENNINEEFLIELFNKAAWYPWLNIYRKKLFDGLIFPVGVYFEDAAVITKIFIRAKVVYLINDELYFYRLNSSGSLLSKDSGNLKKHRESYEYLVKVFGEELDKNKIYSSSYLIILQSYIMFLLRNFGIKSAFITYCKWNVIDKSIEKKYIKNRGNMLFYKYGFSFLVFLRLINR